MAWGLGTGTYTSGTNKTAATTIVMTIIPTANARDVLIASIAMDNLQAVDAEDGTDIVSVTDTQGNTWVRAKTFTNSQGAAAGGATVGIYYSILTTALTSADTITVTFNGSVTAKAVHVSRWTISGNQIKVVDKAVAADDAADPQSLSISGLDSREYLFYHVIASEGPGTDAMTASTNYVQAFKAGTSGGSVATNMTVHKEQRVFTGTGDSVDVSSDTADRDCAQAYVALMEFSYPGWVNSKGGGWF